jgi:hypothetical protein
MRTLDRLDALPLLAATPALAVFAWWMADEGGYAPTSWMPGLVVLTAVACIGVAVAGARPSRPAIGACAALAAFTAWSFASILWSDAPAVALEGSQRSLLYLVCFASFALLPWTPRALLVLLSLFVLVIAGLGLIAVLRLTLAADPGRLLSESRLVGPLGYTNASAALWTIGALPALVLAARPETSAWLRPLHLGAAGLLLGLALLTVSRGWLFTLPMVVLAALVLVPGRFRLLVFAAPVAIALALVSGDLLAPYRAAADATAAASGDALGAAFDEVARSLLLAVGVLVLACSTAVWIDGRLRRRPKLAARVRRRLDAGLLVCLLAACVAAVMVVADGRPLERADRAWEEFKSYDGAVPEGNRLTTLGTNRYDVWRVAVDAWHERPIGGLGQDNFAQRYTLRRANAYDEPRWVHSLPLRLLVHTGAVGALLFALFCIAAVWAAVAGWSRRSDGVAARVAGATALLPATVWVAHGSVDWLWEYPALSGPALALAGAACALAGSAPERAGAPRPASRRRVALAVAAGLLCVVSVAPSYLAERHVRAAGRDWPSDPALAFERLERARSLNPMSARASLVEGTIASRLARFDQARISFERAAAREPKDWFSRFELGLIAGVRADRATAVRYLLAARRLNPREPILVQALERLRNGRPMTLDEAQQVFDSRTAGKIGRRGR